MQEKYQDSLN